MQPAFDLLEWYAGVCDNAYNLHKHGMPEEYLQSYFKGAVAGAYPVAKAHGNLVAMGLLRLLDEYANQLTQGRLELFGDLSPPGKLFTASGAKEFASRRYAASVARGMPDSRETALAFCTGYVAALQDVSLENGGEEHRRAILKLREDIKAEGGHSSNGSD